jgi:hypothetical protein
VSSCASNTLLLHVMQSGTLQCYSCLLAVMWPPVTEDAPQHSLLFSEFCLALIELIWHSMLA